MREQLFLSLLHVFIRFCLALNGIQLFILFVFQTSDFKSDGLLGVDLTKVRTKGKNFSPLSQIMPSKYAL